MNETVKPKDPINLGTMQSFFLWWKVAAINRSGWRKLQLYCLTVIPECYPLDHIPDPTKWWISVLHGDRNGSETCHFTYRWNFSRFYYCITQQYVLTYPINESIHTYDADVCMYVSVTQPCECKWYLALGTLYVWLRTISKSWVNGYCKMQLHPLVCLITESFINYIVLVSKRKWNNVQFAQLRSIHIYEIIAMLIIQMTNLVNQ